MLVSRMRPPKHVKSAAFEPTVTILITAYNEEKDDSRASSKTLSQIDYPPEKLEILVASDGSTDKTDEIVREFAARGVKLFRQEGRVGKTFTQNKAVEQRFGRNNSFFRRDDRLSTPMFCVKCCRILPMNRVGCVAGKLIYVDDSKSARRQGREKLLELRNFFEKKRKPRLFAHRRVGLSLRRAAKSAYQPMYAEACSDFLICTVVYQQGLRSVYEAEAVCTEETNRQSNKEMQMRVRVISQTFTDLWRNREMLNPLQSGFFAVELVSHKLLRYAVPVFLILILFSSGVLAFQSSFLRAAFRVSNRLLSDGSRRRGFWKKAENPAGNSGDSALFRAGESRFAHRFLQIFARRTLRALGADSGNGRKGNAGKRRRGEICRRQRAAPDEQLAGSGKNL